MYISITLRNQVQTNEQSVYVTNCHWEPEYDFHSFATGMVAKDKLIKVATLLHIAGSETQQIFNSFGFENLDDKNKIRVKNKFQEYCQPKKKYIYI